MTHLRLLRSPGLRLTVLFAILLAAATLGARPAAAQEGQGTVIDRTTTFNALADGELCDADGCATVHLAVSPDKTGTTTVVCLGIDSPTGSEQGCADVAATFSMDTDELSAATLAPTAVQLTSQICGPDMKTCAEGPSRTVTVSATWTATGEVERHKETLGDHTGICTTYHRIDALVRDASVTVTIDGASFTTEQAAGLQVIEDTTIRRPCF